jgi:hypothetical protein
MRDEAGQGAKGAGRSPYREREELLVSYPLRSYPAYLSGLLISFLVVPLMAYRLAFVIDRPSTWVILGLFAVAPPLITAAISGSRVGGQKGELRLFRDRVEVPRPFARAPLRFRLADLQIELHVTRTTMSGVAIELPRALTLEGGGERRVLHAELFGSAEALGRAARDILRVQHGHEPEPPPAPPPRDDYDDKLDKELGRLD